MKTYTTSIATYEIKTVPRRHVSAFVKGEAVWEDMTAYHILRDGKLTTVCYDEADIAYVIDCQERPERYAGMNSRFD